MREKAVTSLITREVKETVPQWVGSPNSANLSAEDCLKMMRKEDC